MISTGKAPLDNPPRLWRISKYIYAEQAAAKFKRVTITQPFGLPPGDGFKDVAASGSLDESTTALLMRNAEMYAMREVGFGPFKGKGMPVYQPLLGGNPSRAQIDAAVTFEFEHILGRQPSAEELQRFADLYAKSTKAGDAEVGATAIVVAVLMQPEANFRNELGGGPVSSGKRMLAPRELAFAIAYALTDRSPDPHLLQVAYSGKLATPADVAREVSRLLGDDKIEKPRIMRFFREYFGYGAAVDVFKERKDFPAHDAGGLIADTDLLIGDILKADKVVFTELFTTTKSYIQATKAGSDKKAYQERLQRFMEKKASYPPGDDMKSFLAYSLKDFAPTQPMDLPAEQRAGVLTQPSWLVAHSENSDI